MLKEKGRGRRVPALFSCPRGSRGALPFLQDLEGALELGVVCESLLTGEAPELVRGARFLALFQAAFDVGFDAGALDGLPVWGQPLSGGEHDGRAVTQGALFEHGAGAEGLPADEASTAVIFERADQDLGTRCRSNIYQDHQGSV